MRRVISILMVAALAALMPSCSHYSPEPGGSNDLTGTWSIVMSSNYTAFSYGLTATLTQTGNSVSGTISCNSDSQGCNEGAPTSVTGTVSGTNVTLVMPTNCGGATGSSQTVIATLSANAPPPTLAPGKYMSGSYSQPQDNCTFICVPPSDANNCDPGATPSTEDYGPFTATKNP
ncbi:MAG: hypothetical protein ABSD20_00745 [Terriglobales bacterium]|jgi:hypothetical protein